MTNQSMTTAKYLEKLSKTLASIKCNEMDDAIDAIETAWRSGKQIITLGNGGSSMTALHFINDWNKSIYLSTKIPFRGRSLVDNMGLVMSYSNDISFEDVFIEQLKKYNIVYGFRYIRKDGFLRFLISRVLAFVAFYRTGIWVWDPNCPYRIFKTESISTFVNSVDPTYILINVVLALEHKRMGMKLVNIVFRDRHGGSPSLNTASLVKVGSEFGRQLKHFKK